jgi:hypothetical protein
MASQVKKAWRQEETGLHVRVTRLVHVVGPPVVQKLHAIRDAAGSAWLPIVLLLRNAWVGVFAGTRHLIVHFQSFGLHGPRRRLCAERNPSKPSLTNILVLTLFVSFVGLMFFGERLLDWVVDAPRGDALLFCGAGNGDVAVMERAFSQGATVDARSKTTNTTPLMLACQTHHPEAVRLLLRRGADPNARADRDISPMYNAVLADDADAIVLLVAAGATITEVHFGDTLLDVAERYNSRAATAVLKQLGRRSGTLSW